MEKLINQVLNNLLLEFTVTTGIFGSETYVFIDGAEGKEEFTEAEIVGLFNYADFFFLIDESFIVQNIDMKWKIRQSV